MVTYTETYLVWDKVIARLLRPYRYRDPYWSNTETRTDTETCNTETRIDPIPRTVLIRYRDPYWSDTENRTDTCTEPILYTVYVTICTTRYKYRSRISTGLGIGLVRVSVSHQYGSRYRISTGLGIGTGLNLNNRAITLPY